MKDKTTETSFNFHERLHATESFDQLWQSFHQILAEYGITSVFYGFGHTAKLQEITAIIQSLQMTCSHPNDFMQYMEANCRWDDDVSLLHTLRSEEPLIWHDTTNMKYVTNTRQLHIALESWQYNMGVGVTLPLRFSRGHGLGGFGLAAGNLNGKELDKIWAEHDQKIIQLSALFDILARERHADSLFQLTPKEKECLKWLAAGLRPQQICDKLNNAYRTTEKQIASARHKLNACTNEQAVAKALVYGLLES